MYRSGKVSQHDGNDFPERPRACPWEMPGRANWFGESATCAKAELYYHRIELEQLRPEESSSNAASIQKKRSPRERALQRAELPATNAKTHPRSSRDFSLARLHPLCPWTRRWSNISAGPTYSRGGHARDDQITAISVVSRVHPLLAPASFSFRNFAWEPLTLTALSSRCLSDPEPLEALYAELIAPIREHLNASI